MVRLADPPAAGALVDAAGALVVVVWTCVVIVVASCCFANVGRLLCCIAGSGKARRLLRCVAGDCETGVRIEGSIEACLIVKSSWSGSNISSSDGGSLFGFLVGGSSSESTFDSTGNLMSLS
jgi:hypothetical protein